MLYFSRAGPPRRGSSALPREAANSPWRPAPAAAGPCPRRPNSPHNRAAHRSRHGPRVRVAPTSSQRRSPTGPPCRFGQSRVAAKPAVGRAGHCLALGAGALAGGAVFSETLQSMMDPLGSIGLVPSFFWLRAGRYSSISARSTSWIGAVLILVVQCVQFLLVLGLEPLDEIRYVVPPRDGMTPVDIPNALEDQVGVSC